MSVATVPNQVAASWQLKSAFSTRTTKTHSPQKMNWPMPLQIDLLDREPAAVQVGKFDFGKHADAEGLKEAKASQC